MLKTVRDKLYDLNNHAGFKRYAANTSWMMGEKILRMSVGLFVGIWVARYLGPVQFGLLSYAQSFVFLFTAIATLGLDSIIVRELVKDESRRDELLGTAFGLKLIGALLILPALWLGVQLTSNDDYSNLLIFIIASSTIFQSFNVIDFYYQSKVQSKYVVWANSLSLGLSSFVKILLLVNEAPLFFFAMMVVFDALVIAVGLVFFYKKSSRQKIFSWSFRIDTAKKLLKDSWPLMLSGLVVSVYMKIDQVMIKEMLDVEAVGQYAAAVRLSEAWYFIPMAITSSLFPAIIKSRNISHEIYIKRLRNLYTLMVWLAISVALPMTFLSGWLTINLYGEAYRQAADVLVIHIWAGVFLFIGVAYSNYLVAENLVFKSLYRSAVGALTSVTFNILFIPIYGVIGAAISTLLAQIIANLVYDVFDRDLRAHLLVKLSAFFPFSFPKKK
jgi:O-antigen/teichoic acid export membrane protein